MASAGIYSLHIWCLCGASLKADGVGSLEGVDYLNYVFWTNHTGPPHGPADSKQAARARRRRSLKPTV